MSDDRSQGPPPEEDVGPSSSPSSSSSSTAPSGTPVAAFLARMRADRRLAGGVVLGAVALFAVVALGVTLLLGGDGGRASSSAVTVTPSGDEAPRLGPVLIAFEQTPADSTPERLVSIEPSVEGTFAWLDERRLLFQPAFPGFLRGGEYAVRVDGGVAGIAQDVVQAFTVEGRLTVRSVIPGAADQAVPPEARVFVQFSRSVAPLTLLSEQPTDAVIEFEPALDGHGEWLNTSLYVFTPAALQPSTTYQARIAAGLTSATDGVLEADYEWQFSTYQPAVAEVTPADATSFVAPSDVVRVTFNQPMDRASVEDGVVLRVRDGADVAVDAAWDGDAAVTLTPRQPLAIATTYEVVVPAGLAGAAGGETQAERVTSFATVEEPRLVHSSPRHGETAASRYGVSLEFNNPMDVDSVEEAFSISGVDPEDWRLYTWGDERFIQVDVAFEAASEYTVSIRGARDRAGQVLPDTTFTFTTGQLTPSVSYAIPNQFATYSAGGAQELFFYVTNQSSVRFELFDLAEGTFLALARDGVPFPGVPGWTPGGPVLRSWEVPVDLGEGLSAVASTDVGGGERLRPGYYYLRSPGGAWNAGVLFAVVDTALVTKVSFDELMVWVLDHDTGAPVGGAEVRAQGPGLSGAVARTDAQGIATFSVPRPSAAPSGQSREYTVTVSGEGRAGVSYTGWQHGAEPWLTGVPQTHWDQEMVAHVYTDRPIYRSGETVYFKSVVRLDDDASYHLPEPGTTSLALVVTDAQGTEVLREPVVVTPFGTFSGEFSLPEEAPTGFYQVSVREAREGGWEAWIAGHAFQVAEFRVPEFRVETFPAAPDVLDGEPVEVDLEAAFFFGGPLEGADVAWSAHAFPSGVSFPDYRGYSFSDFDYYATSVFEEPLRASGEATTDAQGRARISAPGVLRAGESTTTFEVSATVVDQSGQAIGASTQVTVHPASVYAGVTTSDYVVRAGTATQVQVATVDTQGASVPSRPVTVEVYEREWVTVREEAASGARRFRSEPRDTLVHTASVTTGADGLGSVSFTPQRSGMVRLVVSTTDDAGRTARAAAYLWVSGGDYAPWRIRNDSIIELVADQESYRVGQTAQVLVPAPYQGARALVTIERGNVLEREVRVFQTNSETLNIPIQDQFVPNVFVTVTLYRAPTAEDPVPRYHVGYVELPVSTEGRELDVRLQPSVEQAQPGETVRYDITVTDSQGRPVEAELSVVTVDAAVLSLSDLVDQTGLQAFWFQRGLGVRTASSLSVSVDASNDAIPEPELGGKGGGADGDVLRADFRNTAFWEAAVQTDAAGRASIEVTLPDNLTTWRTQARAVSGDTMVGEATHELLSTRPVLVRPALPRFARVGDQLTLRTLVRNGTELEQEISVSISVEGLDLEDSGTLTQMVAPGASAEFEWPARAARTGTATVSFRAVAAEMDDAAQVSFPVLLDVTPETMATGGVVVDQSMLEALYLPPYALTDNGSLEVRVQSSLVGALQSELHAFEPFSSEGPMRVASRVVATLAARQADGLEGGALLAGVEGDLRALSAMQRADGGWGWCVRCESEPVATAWVLVAFGDAVDAGWAAPNTSWRRGASYLDGRMRRPADFQDPPDPNARASYLYAMQHASGDDSYLNSLRAVYEQDRERLTSWGRAYLVLALLDAGEEPDDPVVRGLMSDLNASVVASANGNHWEDAPVYGTVETNVSMTSLVVQALVAADPEHPLIEQSVRWLVAARDAQRWQSGTERAQAIRGLGAYAARTGERQGDFDFRVQFNGQDLLAGHLAPGGDSNTAEETLPLTSVAKGEVHRLSFERETTLGRMYYVLNLRYVTPASEVEALGRGLSVAREYTLLGDPERPVSQARLGDLVRVTVTVVADADRKFVTVEDLLPAGLEAIDSQLATVPEDLRRQLEEERQEAVTGGEDQGAHAPWYRWYWSPWDETNVRDDRFTMFATDLPRGVHEYVYYARATTPGDFFVAPATAQEAPFPEVFGRSDSGRFQVVK